MKTIQAEKWHSSIDWYYAHEGSHSAEQFCDDVVIPALNENNEALSIDFSKLKLGVSIQMIWIIGFYLYNKGFSVDELKNRIVIIDHPCKNTHKEFMLSINDAQNQKAKNVLFLK